MPALVAPRPRRVLAALLSGFFVALLVAGCGGDGVKVVPVEGTVTVGTEPLATGSIAFHPDEAKGNKLGQAATGTISNGKYQLSYSGKDGAPVGAYKVTVTATVPVNPKDEYSPQKSVIKESFGTPATTTLTAEVRDGGSPYDFKVTK